MARNRQLLAWVGIASNEIWQCSAKQLRVHRRVSASPSGKDTQLIFTSGWAACHFLISRYTSPQLPPTVGSASRASTVAQSDTEISPLRLGLGAGAAAACVAAGAPALVAVPVVGASVAGAVVGASAAGAAVGASAAGGVGAPPHAASSASSIAHSMIRANDLWTCITHLLFENRLSTTNIVSAIAVRLLRSSQHSQELECGIPLLRHSIL